MICPHFQRTSIKLPKGHKIEDECKVCPLREESTGDCPEDIFQDIDDKLAKTDRKILSIARERVNKIWERFYEQKREKKNG